MMAETRMDILLRRLERMNELADLRTCAEDAAETVEKKKKSGGKSGEDQGGFFSHVGALLFRRGSERRPGILSITHPSDGHPQEELTPDFGWFRPLAHNNATWTLYWPELIV